MKLNDEKLLMVQGFRLAMSKLADDMDSLQDATTDATELAALERAGFKLEAAWQALSIFD